MHKRYFCLNRNTGLSLLELMLVIAVGGMIVLTFTDVLKSNNYKENLNSASKNMLKILQLAAEQKSENFALPSIDDLINSNSINLSQACAPFPGSDLTINANCGSKASYQIVNNGSDQLIGVAVTLTKNDTLKDLYTYLPAATINANTLTTYMPFTNAAQHNSGWLVSGGVWNASSGSQMYLPKCPSGYEGHYIATPLYQKTDCDSRCKNDENLRLHYYGCTYNDQDDDSNESCTNTIYDVPSSPYVLTQLYLIEEEHYQSYNFFLTFCITNGLWENHAYSQNSYQVSGYSAQDGECSAKGDGNNNWSKYNSGAKVLPCGSTIVNNVAGNSW